MGQQVRDDQLGLARLADAHVYHAAVLLGHHAPQLQGDGHPLVLADTAVVVGLEIRHLAVLIQRRGLQIQPRRVDMRRRDLRALGQALLTDDRQHQPLAPVAGVHLIPGLQRHAALILHKALRLCRGDSRPGAEPFGLSLVQEGLVVRAVRLHLRQLRLAQRIIPVLVIPKQLLPQRLHFLAHARSSFNIVSSARRAFSVKAAALPQSFTSTSVQWAR